MRAPISVRLICTNDLFGAFEPYETSFGHVPGARALADHVDRLRSGARHAAWIDGGDFSAGGVIAPATDHELSWKAAGSLPIDAAVPGNHEFDLGDTAFWDRSTRLPFELVAADVDGLDDFVIIASPEGYTVAVIGITMFSRRGEHVYDTPADRAAAATRVANIVDQLPDGIDRRVLVIHDGVPVAATGSAFDELSAFLATVHPHVDAVVGGHTLGRYVGRLGNTLFVQPWAFGSEVAVVDLSAHEARVWLSPVTGSQDWDGPGTDIISSYNGHVVGENPMTLVTPRRRPLTIDEHSLERGLCEGLLKATGADNAIVPPSETGCVQPAIDGIGGYLPAGPVTHAALLRTVPWRVGVNADHVFAAELSVNEVDRLIAHVTPTDQILAGLVRRRPAGVTLISSCYLEAAQRATDHEWTRTPTRLRDGLAAWLDGHLDDPA